MLKTTNRLYLLPTVLEDSKGIPRKVCGTGLGRRYQCSFYHLNPRKNSNKDTLSFYNNGVVDPLFEIFFPENSPSVLDEFSVSQDLSSDRGGVSCRW